MLTESAAFDHGSRDLRVFVSNRESRCHDCGDDLGRARHDLLAGIVVRCVSPARIPEQSTVSTTSLVESYALPLALAESPRCFVVPSRECPVEGGRLGITQ
jgi:hypothetical protein